MRALAEYIMRGRAQATLVVGLTAALPMLFWISAAGASLVLLRKGLNQSLGVIVWSLVPAGLWAWYGDPFVLLAVAGFVSFLSPMASIFAMAVIVGILLIIQGIAFILRGCFSSRLWL